MHPDAPHGLHDQHPHRHAVHFQRLARKASAVSGSSQAFVVAALLVLLWLVLGPLYGFSDAWQLVINTFTSIVTLLLVILLQNSQNRDTAALHLKLNELLRIQEGRTHLLTAEEFSDHDLRHHRREFSDLANGKGKEQGN